MFSKLTRREFAAYLAGFIDGEGCITIKCNGLVRLSITNTVKPVLDGIRARLGYGSIGRRDNKSNKKHKPCYSLWVTDAVRIRGLLRELMPYLRVKTDAAVAAIRTIDAWEARYKAYRSCVAGIYADTRLGTPAATVAARFGVSVTMVYKIRDAGPTYGENCRGGRGKWFARTRTA